MSSFWQETNRSSQLGKIRKTITIPAFAVRCGEDNFSAHLTPRDTGGILEFAANGAGYSIVAAFTVELWLKTTHSHTTKGFVFLNRRLIDADSNVDIGLLNGKVVVRLLKGAAYTTLTSASDYPQGVWFKLSVVYNGSNCKIYFNGVQDANTATLAANLDAATGNQSSHVFGAEYSGLTNFYVGNIAEMSVWNIALTTEQILERLYTRRGKNTGLLSYYKFVDTSVAELIAGTSSVLGSTYRDDDDFPPLIYGSSAIHAKFSVAADQSIALKYPVELPEDANFMLCVSYVTDDEEVVRYKLWDMDGVNFEPSVERYRGQTLPANFILEVWNIDGESDCTLSDDLVIYASKVSNPTSQTDTASIDLVDDPTIDIDISQELPLSFPMTFNSPQWGTVAAPETQPVGTYSTSLSNYGGIQ